MNENAFLSAVQSLADDHQPRVWSLVVSVFGDLAPEGDALSGAALSEILSPVGIRPEAMRVAMHRLRNDGWIETTKRGREAFHSLSSEGITQSAVASRRIYATAHEAVPEWHILCFPAALASDELGRTEQLEKNGYVAIGTGIYLANGRPSAKAPDALLLQGELSNVPKWVRQSIVPRGLDSAFKDLLATLESLDLKDTATNDLTAAQIATLRTLIVHRWRKLVLKLPNVPDTLLGPDFVALTCRAQVIQALNQLPKPRLPDLTNRAL